MKSIIFILLALGETWDWPWASSTPGENTPAGGDTSSTAAKKGGEPPVENAQKGFEVRVKKSGSDATQDWFWESGSTTTNAPPRKGATKSPPKDPAKNAQTKYEARVNNNGADATQDWFWESGSKETEAPATDEMNQSEIIPKYNLRTDNSDSDLIMYLKAHPLPPGEPVPIQVYFTSECPYSQEFMARHMVRLVGNLDVPIDVTLRTSMIGKWDPLAKCNPTQEKIDKWKSEGAKPAYSELACHSNIALLCAWNAPSMDIKNSEYRKKVALFTDEIIADMQQYTFNADIRKAGLSLVEDIAKKHLDWDTLRECMTSAEGETLAQASIGAWPDAVAKAKKKYNNRIEGMFPWVFVNGQMVNVSHGMINDKRAHTVIQLICIAESSIKGCDKELINMKLIEPRMVNMLWLMQNVSVSGESWLFSISTFMLLLALFLGISTFGSWFRSSVRGLVGADGEQLLEREELDVDVVDNIE